MDRLRPREAARDVPDKLALVTPERSFSYAELWHEAEQLVTQLRRPGGVVAFVATPEWHNIAMVWACLQAGVPFLPLHPRWTATDRLAAEARVASESALLTSGQVATVLFSSGSSAAPRGVLLSRGAFAASAAAHAANLPFEPGDRWLLGLPFAHVGGLSIITRALYSRTAVVLSPSSERGVVLDAIERHGVTLLSLVPTVARDLLSMGGGHVLASPRAVLIGGARVPAGLRQELKSEGVRYLATYGMTETCSQIATQSLGDADDVEQESTGTPLAGFEVRVVGADGDELPIGQRGRIEVRGPALLSGYLGEPARDPAAFFDTRDVGCLDASGRLFVIGRADETIISGGENVFPSEVEAVLSGIAGVREVAVFGVPDERWGELVAVAIVVAPGTPLTSLWREAREGLASFRVPRRFALLDSLPRGANGKLDLRALRALSLEPCP